MADRERVYAEGLEIENGPGFRPAAELTDCGQFQAVIGLRPSGCDVTKGYDEEKSDFQPMNDYHD